MWSNILKKDNLYSFLPWKLVMIFHSMHWIVICVYQLLILGFPTVEISCHLDSSSKCSFLIEGDFLDQCLTKLFSS